MTTHKLYLPFAPMPSPRPRFRVIGKFASAYMPADYKKWKAAVADFLKDTGVRVGETTVEVKIACLAKRPKTSKLRAPKPDVDNYAKSVLDAATDAGVWTDDTQVVGLEVWKAWHELTDPFEGGEGIVLIIKEL